MRDLSTIREGTSTGHERRGMRRISRQTFFALSAVALACGVVYGFAPTDPIQLTRRFKELEALARDGSRGARQALIASCFSKQEPLQTKRFACRILSRVASPSDLADAPHVGRSDYLWVSWRLVQIAVAARDKGDVKDELTEGLLAFLRDLPRQPREGKPGLGMERHLAAQEIGFYVAENHLPLRRFPSEVVDRSPDVALERLRARYASVTASKGRAKRIGALLVGEADVFVREAAIALMIEMGESAVPAVEAMLERSVPRRNPPPFTAVTRTYKDCLRVLAGIGGERPAATLESLAKNSVPYVSDNAGAALRWVKAGVGYQPLYARLFQHPYAEE
jgi:hypothetical protein